MRSRKSYNYLKLIKKQKILKTDEKLFMKHILTKEYKKIKFIANKLIKYNWSTYPHRCLLVLDDFANHQMLRHKENKIRRLLKKLGHFNTTVIICVQTVKSIPKDIKRTLSDLILHSGIGEDDFMDLIKESPASIFDEKKLWNEYRC